MTPIDPFFLLLPIFQATNSLEGLENHFRPADDIFEDAAREFEKSSQTSHEDSVPVSLKDVLHFASFQCTKNALQFVCDTKEVTSELVVYRYSTSKVLEYLRKKVSRLACPHVIDESRTLLRNLAKEGLMDDGNESLLEAGRTRAACELLSQYLPVQVRGALVASYDFSALSSHISRLQLEIVTVTDTRPMKRSLTNGQNKPAEDKKRKGKVSHGVEKLKKANVNGMAKISTFFKKS
ncbi:hypothetical protein AX17_001406 [Amanita inopinata Kibby_2008]|nr:hypothetical protein AX17_001406 [Amanita inopinata Kibby_2008]